MSEWINWSGGKCPVGPNAVVNIQLRRDSREFAQMYHERFGPIDADHVRWTWNPHHPSSDVIAYRVVQS